MVSIWYRTPEHHTTHDTNLADTLQRQCTASHNWTGGSGLVGSDVLTAAELQLLANSAALSIKPSCTHEAAV